MEIENIITKKIKEKIHPFYFKLINFSEQHRHHESNDRGDYSHIKLIIAAEDFNNKNKISRERIIHHILNEELKHHIHALVLKLYSINEFKLLSTHDLNE